MEVFHEPRFAGDLNRVVPLLSQLQGMLVEPMRVSVSTHDVIEKVGARRSWRGWRILGEKDWCHEASSFLTNIQDVKGMRFDPERLNQDFSRQINNAHAFYDVPEEVIFKISWIEDRVTLCFRNLILLLYLCGF